MVRHWEGKFGEKVLCKSIFAEKVRPSSNRASSSTARNQFKKGRPRCASMHRAQKKSTATPPLVLNITINDVECDFQLTYILPMDAPPIIP